jgi:hypothetical protein
MLEAQDLPYSQRRPVSLITALREALLQGESVGPNKPSQAGTLRAVVDELTRKGFDGDSLVRYGLSPELATSVLGQVLRRWMPGVRVARHASDAIVPALPPSPKAEGPSDRGAAEGSWESVLAPELEAKIGPVNEKKITNFIIGHS